MTRKAHKARSNNSDNPNKNVCALAAARFLGVDQEVRYLHTVDDLVRASRKRWVVRSRKSDLRSGSSVGAAREQIAGGRVRESHKAVAYIVRVDGHVLILNKHGATVCDTASRKRDRRKITHFYMVSAG